MFLSGCDHGKLLRQGKQEGEAPRLGVAGRGGALPERSALEHALHQAGRAGGARPPASTRLEASCSDSRFEKARESGGDLPSRLDVEAHVSRVCRRVASRGSGSGDSDLTQTVWIGCPPAGSQDWRVDLTLCKVPS